MSDSLQRYGLWHPTSVLLSGKSHRWRSLVGCSPRGHEESDTTTQLHFHFLLSCIGEENGNPLQCSCLENTRNGEAWWAAISGVAQSQTRLKGLSSSSSSSVCALSHFNCVRLSASLWTVTCQAPLPMGFSRQEYWSGPSRPPPWNLPYPGIEPTPLYGHHMPVLAGGFFTTSATWEPPQTIRLICKF